MGPSILGPEAHPVRQGKTTDAKVMWLEGSREEWNMHGMWWPLGIWAVDDRTRVKIKRCVCIRVARWK